MGFKKIFWGFIFLFDFRIGGFDILPDIIAYILIYQGLSIIAERNENFEKAKSLSFPLIFISILDIYQVTIPLNEIGNNSLGILGIIIGIVLVIINLLMVYRICIGIAEEARLINDTDLDTKAIHRWKLYLVNNIIILVCLLLPILLQMLFIVILIISVVSYLLMVGLMNMASDKLEKGI